MTGKFRRPLSNIERGSYFKICTKNDGLQNPLKITAWDMVGEPLKKSNIDNISTNNTKDKCFYQRFDGWSSL